MIMGIPTLIVFWVTESLPIFVYQIMVADIHPDAIIRTTILSIRVTPK